MDHKEFNSLNPEEITDFQVYVPIDVNESVKKSEDNNGEWLIQGYATSPSLDRQNDILPPEAIDISQFVSKSGGPTGYINYEHREGSDYLIGQPTANTFIDFDRGLFVEAKLFPDNPYAKSVWELANNIKKSGSDARFGYSVEGRCRGRNKFDRRVMTRMEVTNVAVTTNPANPESTWEAVAKSLTTGHGITPETQRGASALRTELLGNSVRNLSWTLDKLEDKDQFEKIFKNVTKYMDAHSLNSQESAIILLQVSRGLSRHEAQKMVKKYLDN